MALDKIIQEKRRPLHKKPDSAQAEKQQADTAKDNAGLLSLHDQVGNLAVQRLLAQRKGDKNEDGSFAVEESVTAQINQARGGGQSLDEGVQAKMEDSMGHDFSGVSVHTSSQADQLNENLSAKAFTTGQDIFFSQGAYQPNTSEGQELLAHELTHVVQQSQGQVSDGDGGMTVNAPNDVYEQEADAVAQTITQTEAPAQVGGAVQREDIPEEPEEVQAKAIQREDVPEEEPEEVQAKAIQREDMPEEEPEEVQTQAIQREDVEEPEEI